MQSFPADADPKDRHLIVAGYATETLGLLGYLTINGASGVPPFVAVVTAALIVLGLLLPAAGMLRWRSALPHDRLAARHGLVMQASGFAGLVLAIALLQVSSSLSPLYAVSGLSILSSGAAALAGASLLRTHHDEIGAANGRGSLYLILGTMLMFSGVALILGSNLASYFILSNVGNTVCTDIGASISACGCVIAACSFLVAHPRPVRTKQRGHSSVGLRESAL